MRLDEHTIDLFEIDDAGLVSHGLNEGTHGNSSFGATYGFQLSLRSSRVTKLWRNSPPPRKIEMLRFAVMMMEKYGFAY